LRLHEAAQERHVDEEQRRRGDEGEGATAMKAVSR
jgi:hypothetical protein